MAPALLLVPAALASFVLAFGTGVEFVRFTSLRPLLGGVPEPGGPGLLPCAGAGRAPGSEVSSGPEALLPPSAPGVRGAADGAVGGAHAGRRPPPPGASPHPLPRLGARA
ncbi:nurim isoform X2 [Meriones unguiculatus]|uniref:nurim isoform X2 n=1 Tax=Meriones unguiculatus TaxID=10047 RepID=UPI000B4F76D5|nr:nurim isoform X2 [Meriones unguiculatus]